MNKTRSKPRIWMDCMVGYLHSAECQPVSSLHLFASTTLCLDIYYFYTAESPMFSFIFPWSLLSVNGTIMKL